MSSLYEGMYLLFVLWTCIALLLMYNSHHLASVRVSGRACSVGGPMMRYVNVSVSPIGFILSSPTHPAWPCPPAPKLSYAQTEDVRNKDRMWEEEKKKKGGGDFLPLSSCQRLSRKQDDDCIQSEKARERASERKNDALNLQPVTRNDSHHSNAITPAFVSGFKPEVSAELHETPLWSETLLLCETFHFVSLLQLGERSGLHRTNSNINRVWSPI